MSYIKPEFIDRLRCDADIIYVFEAKGDSVQKKGVNYFCKSPYTDEKTASCMVSPKTQRYKDFSTGKSGDVITYLMHRSGCT